MSVSYLITLDVVRDRRDEFLRLLGGVLDAMRCEAMFHEAILHQDPVSENRFLLYEKWESHEDVLNVQLHRPYRAGWHQALPHLLVKEREISMWQPLRTDHQQATNPGAISA